MARNFHWSLPPPWFLLLIPVKASLPWRWKEDVTDVVKALNNDREPPSSLWLTLGDTASLRVIDVGHPFVFPFCIFSLPVAEILASARVRWRIYSYLGPKKKLVLGQKPIMRSKKRHKCQKLPINAAWSVLFICLKAAMPSPSSLLCVHNWRVNWTKSLRHKNYNIQSAITLFCIYWCKQTE